MSSSSMDVTDCDILTPPPYLSSSILPPSILSLPQTSRWNYLDNIYDSLEPSLQTVVPFYSAATIHTVIPGTKTAISTCLSKHNWPHLVFQIHDVTHLILRTANEIEAQVAFQAVYTELNLTCHQFQLVLWEELERRRNFGEYPKRIPFAATFVPRSPALATTGAGLGAGTVNSSGVSSTHNGNSAPEVLALELFQEGRITWEQYQEMVRGLQDIAEAIAEKARAQLDAVTARAQSMAVLSEMMNGLGIDDYEKADSSQLIWRRQ
ncbi:hypothetical protein HK102_004762 [Quaeritorhiza haematococci]|nr:hypothetical protein HK102_004762 [Quaeritorhiza haematococci]